MGDLFKVYIKLDENNNIIEINSNVFINDLSGRVENDLAGWVEIDSGADMKYLHAQNNYFDKPIITEYGVYRYQYVDGIVNELTDEEITELETVIMNNQLSVPSQLDIIEAQVTYTAMMTDTLLEG